MRAFSFRRRDEGSRWIPFLPKECMDCLNSSIQQGRAAVWPSEFRVWTMAIVQSQWWYQYLSKKSTRSGSRSSRDQHVHGLRVHPRMDVQDPDRNEQDLRQPGTILVCKKQINSSRRGRQFQERVKQSAVRLNACSEQVTTQEETTPTVHVVANATETLVYGACRRPHC